MRDLKAGLKKQRILFTLERHARSKGLMRDLEVGLIKKKKNYLH